MTIEDAVISLLEYLDFHVARVEEGERKTPDLLAEKEGEIFLIEIKTKQDDAGRKEQMNTAFELDSIFEEVLPMGPRNRVSAIVQHGVQQLGLQWPGEPLRLLWFTALGQRSEVYARQIRATLLGSTRLIDLQETAWQRECFFFHNSAFHRWQKDLDGAVIAQNKSGQLLVNPFSPRADRLRRSPLAVTFGRGVLDPTALAADGDACIVDGDVDRGNEAAVQSHLQQKYKRPMLQSIEMGYHAVWAGLPVDELTEDKETES